MAEGVEGAACIVAFLSQSYQKSDNVSPKMRFFFYLMGWGGGVTIYEKDNYNIGT